MTSKRTTALTLALALAAGLLWRWWQQEPEAEQPEAPDIIEVSGVGRVRLEPDKRKRDAWQAHYDRKAGDA